MSVDLHDAHEFAWLTAPIRYTAAQDLHFVVKHNATVAACRARGLTPAGFDLASFGSPRPRTPKKESGKKKKHFSFCQCPALPFSGSTRLPRTGPAVRGTAYGHWLKEKINFLPVPCPSLFGQHEAAPDRTRCAGNRLRALAFFKLAFKIKTA